MRRPILAAILGLALASDALSDEVEQPIPQDYRAMQKRRAEALAWTRRTVVDAYEKVGKKDPRWDPSARKTLDLAARMMSQQVEPAVGDEEVYPSAKAAIEAGCDDPLILYVFARTATGRNDPGFGELSRRYSAAATALESSKYPAVRRAVGLIFAGLYKTYEVDPAARKEAGRMFDAALALMPESFRGDGNNFASRRVWKSALVSILQGMTSLAGDRKTAFDKIDAALEKIPAAKSLQLGLRGIFYTDYAWDARGSGMANTVTEDGWRKFSERASEARKSLQEAWDLDPTDAETAGQMIVVELAIGGANREEMEKWFQRAMELDNDNLTFCKNKLYWLEPKWHGSAEDMLAFARLGRDTRSWRTGVALLPAEAHRRLAQYFPFDQQILYYQKPEVWDEIRGVYLDALANVPDDAMIRSEFAGYCYLCSHYDEANAQFQKLGETLRGTRTFSEKWLKETRYATTERMRGDLKPNTPPAKGLAVLHASYGTGESWVDVAAQARVNITNDRLKLSTEPLPDPMFGTAKALAVVYSLDGKVGLAVSQETKEFTLPPKEPGRMSAVPAQGFVVLEARFGDAERWIDVTDAIRKNIIDGRLASIPPDLPDPAFGVHKALVIAYSWEGRVLLSITRDDKAISLPLAQPPGAR